MDKKRAAQPLQDPDAVPPAKHFRPAPSDPAPPEQDDPKDAIQNYQRSQLAAKIAEQNRDLFWLREKVNELQKLVAVLDAAPRAALYHMHAVREDLTLTLARLGLPPQPDPASCPIAATMLDAEVVTNESLAEIPAELKKLTAQIVLVIEAKDRLPAPDPERKRANDELHRRIRDVSDQLERYAERDKQSLVSSTTFRDEYDDLRLEAAAQRTKIVALQISLREKTEEINEARARGLKQEGVSGGEEPRAGGSLKPENVVADTGEPSTQVGAPNGEVQSLVQAEAAARELADNRLVELQTAHFEEKKMISEVETLKAAICRWENNVVPLKTVINSALYQTMEATLQQLYLKEKTWESEREAEEEEREAERKDAQERLEEANTTAEKGSDDLRRQMEDLRRIADAAKIEKDKVVMTYEARKMEAGNAAAVISAAERRARVSEEMRKKLASSNGDLKKENEKFQVRLQQYDKSAKDKETVRVGCFFSSHISLDPPDSGFVRLWV